MRKLLPAFLLVTWLLVTGDLTFADIKLKIAAVNPSQTETQTTPVRYDLPKGMEPDTITDIGGMELKYDFDKGSYYLYKVVKLKPSEKMLLEVRLRDIWTVPREETAFLKNHTRSLTAKLRHTKHAKVGGVLAGKIIDRLNAISNKEADQSLSMGDHINLYYENMGILRETKDDIGMLENLVLDVGGIVEERVQVPSTLAVPIKTDEKSGVNLVELNIKVSNPSTTAKQSADLKYLLPEEVAPRYIADRNDLGIGYDFDKKAFYVYKDNIALNPSEARIFVIKIMDMWKISDVETDALKIHVDNLMLLLKGTEHIEDAKPIADKVRQDMNEIKTTQSMKVSADEHIAYYRKNTALLEEARKFVAQLEKLASQSGASVGVTIKEAEIQRGGGPKIRRARGYEGIDYIVKSIFRGKSPTVATTWKIIFAILIFIGILSALFFWLWYVQVKEARKTEEKMETIKQGSGVRK